MDMRYAFGEARSSAGPLDVGVFAYRPDGGATAYSFVTLTRSGRGIGPFAPLVESVRRIPAAEAAAVRPLRIKVLRVKAGETPQTFARMMAFPDNPLDRFLVLNGLTRGAVLRPGDRVKVILRR